MEFTQLLENKPVSEEMTVTTATRRYTSSMDTIKERVNDNMLQGSDE